MEVDQDRIDQIATCFADQLQLLHPDVNSLDDVDIKDYIRNFAGNLAETDLESDNLLKALRLAATKWASRDTKAISSATSGVASFSLLDQLQGGFALPVTIDEINEAASDEERLALFQKISYVDDVLPDWTEVRSLLKSSLQNSNTQIALEYLKLHRKFFGLCRSSAEYDSLAFNLCQNLMEVAITTISDASSGLETDFFIRLMQNWRDMFLDLMQRDRYVVTNEAMETNFLNLLRTIISRPNHSIQPCHILSLVDPRAMWFQSWVQNVAPKHLVYLLEKNSGVLPDLLRRGRANNNIPETSKELAAPVVHATRLQAVSILSHILCKTRVALFPWNLLSNIQTEPLGLPELASSPADDEDHYQLNLQRPDKKNLDSILQMFLEALTYDDKDEYKLACWTAIETLLWGYKCFDMDAADTLSSVNKSLQESTSESEKEPPFATRLHEVMSVLA
jgi:hypothetical protein